MHRFCKSVNLMQGDELVRKIIYHCLSFLFLLFLLRKRQICNTYNKILWDLWCEIEMYKDNKCWTIHSKEKIEKRILVLKHFHSDHVYVQHVTDRRVLFCLCSSFSFSSFSFSSYISVSKLTKGSFATSTYV